MGRIGRYPTRWTTPLSPCSGVVSGVVSGIVIGTLATHPRV